MATPREIYSAARLTHACHDPVLCMAPGLFRSVVKGKRGSLTIRYVHSPGVTIKAWAPESLGADDLRVLQVLVALAATQWASITDTSASSASKALRAGMELNGDTSSQETLIVRGSYRELAREMGYRNTENTRPIQKCIKRLANVSVEVLRNGTSGGFRILSEYRDPSEKCGLCIALNPRFNATVDRKSPFTIIRLDEARKLGSDASRLIHQRLSAWINAGKTRLCNIDTLCSYVWPEPTESAETGKSRLRTTRKAMVEIAGTGWRVEEYQKDKFRIARPAYKLKTALPDEDKPAAPSTAIRPNQQKRAASWKAGSQQGKISTVVTTQDPMSLHGQTGNEEVGLLVAKYTDIKKIKIKSGSQKILVS